MSDDSLKIIRTKGAIKLLAGIIMLPLSFIVVFIGFLIRMIGVLGLIAGAINKVTSVYASNEENKIFWEERTHRLIFFGSVTFISGLVLEIPFLPGIILILEGIYNLVAIDEACGSAPTLKIAGEFFAGLVSGATKKLQLAKLNDELKAREAEVKNKNEPKSKQKEAKVESDNKE